MNSRLGLDPRTSSIVTLCLTGFLGAVEPCTAAARPPSDFGESDGAHSTRGAPHIPEPMYFDLVRPLGVRRGDLEVNVLAQRALRDGSTEWAPEIEYGMADGLAGEFELPMEGSRLQEYKLALQGTFGTLRSGALVHGWQMIGRYDRSHSRWGADALYLIGAEFGGGWSGFGMFGLRRAADDQQSTDGLVNLSAFRELTPALTLGLETNSVIENGRLKLRLLPQAHIDLTRHVTLQLGIGGYVQPDSQRGDTALTTRLIHTW